MAWGEPELAGHATPRDASARANGCMMSTDHKHLLVNAGLHNEVAAIAIGAYDEHCLVPANAVGAAEDDRRPRTEINGRDGRRKTIC